MILTKLFNIGVRGIALELFRSYLSDRSQRVRFTYNSNGAILNVLSEPITISKGVPQGSILGPLLFVLYVNNLKESLNKYSPCQFADDTSCIAIGKDLHTTSAEASDAISKMYKYCEAQFLELNMNKTLVVQYRNGPMSSSIYIKLGTKSVPLADEVKFLGLYIDKALKFNAHSNYVCRKLAKYSYIIRNLRTSVSIDTLKMFYFAYVHSTLSYGLIFWGSSTSSKEAFVLQKRIIRCMLFKKPHESFSQYL
ncbi:putative RNA-directed DNA polymerase from transposon BS-like Protein [Tribolium castaneum]|uniref:Putative RNA-directed DNA polymerase from transposon BS-like Protein n=1 Tax=Tribolium castaneum TaxID=7070 RepID=A0A139W9Q6_TRICA|nr:putative RNA-directed DNA polymerase from transposon BS-like Protein [Tribolium castaneum]